MDDRARLMDGARALGLALAPAAAERLLRLLDELTRWNSAYNLTAIVERPKMITHHLLDSLSIHADLLGTRIADVGTGAGFPGLPLAIIDPTRQFTLIDSNNKKVRFVAHVARQLELANVEPVHSRVEGLVPEAAFDTVVARAFASLADILKSVAPLCGPATRVLAMKGKVPDAEIAAIGPPWSVTEVRQIEVPDLAGARSLIVLERSGSPASLPV